MPALPSFPLELVLWRDHVEAMQPWEKLSALELVTPVIAIVGWIVRETPDTVVVAPVIALDEADPDTSGAHALMKSAIVKRTPIKVPK